MVSGFSRNGLSYKAVKTEISVPARIICHWASVFIDFHLAHRAIFLLITNYTKKGVLKPLLVWNKFIWKCQLFLQAYWEDIKQSKFQEGCQTNKTSFLLSAIVN